MVIVCRVRIRLPLYDRVRPNVTGDAVDLSRLNAPRKRQGHLSQADLKAAVERQGAPSDRDGKVEGR
jgi:hypothetical protein